MPSVDILDAREPVRRSFAGSIALHAAVFTVVLASAWIKNRPRDTFGDPNSLGGGSVGVTAVKSIPFLTPQGPKNPVANDTDSQVPEPVAPAKPAVKAPEPDAINLRSRNAPRKPSPAPRDQSQKKYQQPLEDNQLTSRAGQSASSPLYGMVPGAGGVGVGSGTPFGSRFGAYAALIQDKVARVWRTDEVDPRLRTAPPVIVIFDLSRDGRVSNPRLAQRSGNLALDNSALRAVTQAAPFPPLPPQYERDSATIEFWFQLQR